MQILLLAAGLAVLGPALSASAGLAASTGCLACHGDAGVMKSLVTPKAPMAAEGEG
jgi:cytochrome c553